MQALSADKISMYSATANLARAREFCATVERRRALPAHYQRAFAEIGAAMRSWIGLF